MKQPTHINPYVGQRIRLARRQLGISQEALASDLNISVNYLGELERGKRIVNLKMAEKFCRYFHITLDYLYSGISPQTVFEQTSYAADPRRELTQLLELCTAQEIRLCIDICRPVLIAWRNALRASAKGGPEPSKSGSGRDRENAGKKSQAPPGH